MIFNENQGRCQGGDGRQEIEQQHRQIRTGDFRAPRNVVSRRGEQTHEHIVQAMRAFVGRQGRVDANEQEDATQHDKQGRA